MDELVADLHRRADAYILQCDDFYAHLVRPFLLLKDPVFDTEPSDPPLPSFLDSGLTIPDDPLPSELFEL
jgi:hypothetical protein